MVPVQTLVHQVYLVFTLNIHLGFGNVFKGITAKNCIFLVSKDRLDVLAFKRLVEDIRRKFSFPRN